MAKFRVTVEGNSEVKRKLRQLPKAVRGKALKRAAQEGADVFVAGAKAVAPVSPGGPTRGGKHLKDAIISEVEVEDDRQVVVKVGPHRDQFHGIFSEVGTAFQPAQPWLRPTFDTEKDNAREAAAKHLRVSLLLLTRR